MMNIKKTFALTAALGVLLAPMATLAANTMMAQTSVKDKTGRSVMSMSGGCVLTKWTASTSDCKSSGNVRLLSQEQRTVYFDFNKSTLSAAEKKKLDGVAKIIASSKEVGSVNIVGHADKIGKAGYNKALSMRRAETVKAFLANKGLKTKKVRVDGMGDEDSVTSCDANANRAEKISCMAADRRVVIELNFVK